MKKTLFKKIFNCGIEVAFVLAIFFAGYFMGESNCAKSVIPQIQQAKESLQNANDSLRVSENGRMSLISAISFLNSNASIIDHFELINGHIVFYMKDGSLYEYVGDSYMASGYWTNDGGSDSYHVDPKESVSA